MGEDRDSRSRMLWGIQDLCDAVMKSARLDDGEFWAYNFLVIWEGVVYKGLVCNAMVEY